MKKILLSLIMLMAISNSYSQGHFENGDNVLGVGIGFGSTLAGSYTYGSQTPGLCVLYEHGMWDLDGPGVVSLGGYLGYKGYSYNYGGYRAKWNYTVIGFRSAYHYNGLETTDWDVYGGAMLSFRITSYSDNDPFPDGSYSSGINLSLYIGGRYYFTDKVAAYAELGYGISYLTLGAAFMLGN